MKAFFLIVLLFFSSTAFSAYYSDNIEPAPTPMAYRTSLPYFNKIEIDTGDRVFDVRVIANTQYHDLQILNVTINPKILYKMDGQTLQVALQSPKDEIEDDVVAIVIRCPGELRSLTFIGEGQLIGVKMDSSYLDLDIEGGGVIQLQGKSINLNRVYFTGATHTKVTGVTSHSLHVAMYKQAEAALFGDINVKDILMFDSSRLIMLWVDSTDLVINLNKNSYAYLAGVSNILEATLNGNSKLNARYLRAKRGFVTTNNRSHADLQVSNDLNTIARDDSDIYFYKEPRQNNPRMISNGAVLDMTDLQRLKQQLPCGDCFSRLFQEK